MSIKNAIETREIHIKSLEKSLNDRKLKVDKNLIKDLIGSIKKEIINLKKE